MFSRIPPHWREELGRLFRFGLVGLFNTGVGLGTIYLLQNGLDWDYRAANIIGYCLGITLSFILNRSWTFKSADTRITRQGILFLLVAGTCWGVQLAALIVMVEILGISKELAQPLGMVVYTSLNYPGNRFIVFRTP
jgi:putative flippase GtrA